MSDEKEFRLKLAKKHPTGKYRLGRHIVTRGFTDFMLDAKEQKELVNKGNKVWLITEDDFQIKMGNKAKADEESNIESKSEIEVLREFFLSRGFDTDGVEMEELKSGKVEIEHREKLMEKLKEKEIEFDEGASTEKLEKLLK